MDTSTVSARKYRPNLFKEVRSQSQVITTLRNQVKSQKIPQVVIFCGPRGSGKTSSARIFAKAINCTALEASGEPCNRCLSCQHFQQSTSMNIHELDAASNNSVEDARQLLEQVRFHPTSGKKVFIIDEVHMLSNAAFNALLKTLEEPPAHVVFILATTEKHKIIPTILSRCQVFDFHPIVDKEIFAQLQYIAQREGITTDEEALHLISEQSEGSFREALHAFDKIVAFSGGKTLTKEDVLSNLQIIDHTHYFSITDALYQGEIQKALQAYDQILREGFESQYFIKGLSKHCRHLLVSKTGGSSALINASDTLVSQYRQQAEHLKSSFLYQALTLLEQCELHYKARQDKRLHVEITLIKISYLRSTHTSSHKPKDAPLPQEPSPKMLPKRVSGAPSIPPSLPKQVQPSPSKESHAPHAAQPSAAPAAQPPKATLLPTEEARSLSLEQLKLPWHTYKEKLKAQGAMAAWATMGSPITLDQGTIVLEITNSLQKDALRPHHEDLVSFLNQALGRKDLQLMVQVSPLPQSAKKTYTAQEQLTKLIERYPAVQDLKESLELT